MVQEISALLCARCEQFEGGCSPSPALFRCQAGFSNKVSTIVLALLHFPIGRPSYRESTWGALLSDCPRNNICTSWHFPPFWPLPPPLASPRSVFISRKVSSHSQKSLFSLSSIRLTSSRWRKSPLCPSWFYSSCAVGPFVSLSEVPRFWKLLICPWSFNNIFGCARVWVGAGCPAPANGPSH